MTASFTEGKHEGEFIISEANGTRSRETITVASGQKLEDGQAFQLSGGKAVAKDANVNTDGTFVTPLKGFIIGNWDASATGTNADITDVPYIARDAEVKAAALKLPTGKEALAKSDAATNFGIISR